MLRLIAWAIVGSIDETILSLQDKLYYTRWQLQLHLCVHLFSEELKCAICLHRLQKPRALGCLHSFCEKCLGKYVDEKATIGPVSCPLCQKETALPYQKVGLQLSLQIFGRLSWLKSSSRKKDEVWGRKVCIHVCATSVEAPTPKQTLCTSTVLNARRSCVSNVGTRMGEWELLKVIP